MYRSFFCMLEAVEDLRDCPGFAALAGPAAMSSLMGVVGTRCSDDIESSDDEEDANVGDDCV